MNKIYTLLGIALILTNLGCKTDISGNSYSVGSVGSVNRAVEGTVISKREIDVLGSSDLGGGAGATGGAIIGGNAAGDSPLGVVGGVVAGAIVGGIVGGAIEKEATQQKGFEYVVRTANGSLLTVVQGVDPVINKNDKVIVLYGTKSRIIPSD